MILSTETGLEKPEGNKDNSAVMLGPSMVLPLHTGKANQAPEKESGGLSVK